MKPNRPQKLPKPAKQDIARKVSIIGDAPYAADYVRQVKNTGDKRVVIPGAIYGEGYRQLQSHCAVRRGIGCPPFRSYLAKAPEGNVAS